jgi:hypothetical protein
MPRNADCGGDIPKQFGFIAEKIEEDNPIDREFLPAASSLHALKKKYRSFDPQPSRALEKYAKELELYRRDGAVWTTIDYVLALFGFSLPDAVLTRII